MKRDRIVMIGSGCIDEYYELDYVPGMGEKTICHPKGALVGGMIGNAASVAAAYGMDTYLMDVVNRGSNVEIVLEDCKKQGIKLDLMRYDDSLPDVKCMIFLKDGERMIYVVPTQKRELTLDAAQEKILEETAYIYSTTMELRCFKRPFEVINGFRSRGSKLVLDVEYLDGGAIDTEWEIIRKADILFVNSEGDGQMKEKIALDYSSVLNQEGCTVIVTKGDKGCSIYEPSGNVTDINAYRVPLVDTTGAGDTFNASFVYGMSQGWGVKEAGEFASAAAARSIGYMGPRSGAVGVEKVAQFINTYKESPLRIGSGEN